MAYVFKNNLSDLEDTLSEMKDDNELVYFLSYIKLYITPPEYECVSEIFDSTKISSKDVLEYFTQKPKYRYYFYPIIESTQKKPKFITFDTLDKSKLFINLEISENMNNNLDFIKKQIYYNLERYYYSSNDTIDEKKENIENFLKFIFKNTMFDYKSYFNSIIKQLDKEDTRLYRLIKDENLKNVNFKKIDVIEKCKNQHELRKIINKYKHNINYLLAIINKINIMPKKENFEYYLEVFRDTEIPEYVLKNFLNLNNNNNNNNKYQCIFTAEDCSTTGGYTFKEHLSPTNNKCKPDVLISHEGFVHYTNDTIKCIYCEKVLSKSDFLRVKPKKV